MQNSSCPFNGVDPVPVSTFSSASVKCCSPVPQLKLTYPSKDEVEMLRDWGQHNVSSLGFIRETMAAHESQLSSLTVAGALPTLFSDLQRLAVGLEQAMVEAALTGNVAGMDIFRTLQAGLIQVGFAQMRPQESTEGRV